MTVVDLFPDADQQQFLDMTRQALEQDFPLADLCRHGDLKDVSDRRWALAASLAWPACGLPSDIGGAGFNAADEALLFRELGRSLVTPAVMASLWAGLIILPHDPDIASQFASGVRRAALAFSAAAARGEEHSLMILEGEQATDVVWYSATEGLALVPYALIREAQAAQCIDPTLSLTKGVLQAGTDACRAAPSLGIRAQLHLSAQLVGLAEAARDMAVAHAKLREQFGQPIGAFQAIAHHCVDMELRAQAALSQLLFAAIACRDTRHDAAFQTRCALLVAADAAFRNATMNIRILGGMGYSEESGAHLYLKRSVVLRTLAGLDAGFSADLRGQPDIFEAGRAGDD